MSDGWFATGFASPRVIGAALIVAGLAFAGCSDKSEEAESPQPPGTLIEADGSDIPRIELTEKAEERLGIEMDQITGTPDALVAPYDAVFYHADGSTWVYTNPDAQIYERSAIAVSWIENGLALLDSGPPAGTEVVVIGGAELHGLEEGL